MAGYMTVADEIITIMTVDDHPLLRDGISALIANHADLKLVAEASDGREALVLYRRWQPDVVLMDLQLPGVNGIDTMISIRAEYPLACVVVLTTYGGDALAQRAMKGGASAYVLKNLVRKELLETIRAVHAGQKQVHPTVAAEIAIYAGDGSLTNREIEVLRLAASGLSNKKIGMELSINDGTVKGHMQRIMEKLRASDRTHAVTTALKRGIIQLHD
jgi:DNA-binding NarL/FixJ family response regulator